MEWSVIDGQEPKIYILIIILKTSLTFLLHAVLEFFLPGSFNVNLFLTGFHLLPLAGDGAHGSTAGQGSGSGLKLQPLVQAEQHEGVQRLLQLVLRGLRGLRRLHHLFLCRQGREAEGRCAG